MRHAIPIIHFSRIPLLSGLILSLIMAWFFPPVHAAGPEKLVFVRGGNIWIAHTDGSGQRQLTFSDQDGGPALSPDGRTVVFHSHDREKDFFIDYGNLYAIPAAGGQPKLILLPGFQAAEHAGFSADGKRLVFVGLSDYRTKGSGDNMLSYARMSVAITVLDTHTTRTIRSVGDVMLDAGYVFSNPSFSPDGMLVAFQHSGSDVSGGFEVIDLSGKKRFSYPKDGHSPIPYWRPRFFPDGGRILCYSPATSEKRKDMIFVIDITTGNKNAITEGANPALVEGGKAIVFERWTKKWTENARADLWYLRLDRPGKAKKIIDKGSEPSGLGYRPGGERQ